jgi:parallel beta-helix repeat protein
MTPFTGLKVYRNSASGFFLHRCHNISIENSLFADNNVGIDLDRAEGNQVTNVRIIGQSPLYTELMARQPGVAPVCDIGVRTGFDIHTWQRDPGYLGAKISNVQMSGFDPNDPKCPTPLSMRFESFVSGMFFYCPAIQHNFSYKSFTYCRLQNLKQGLFEFYTAFSGMQLADGLGSINMCIINLPEFDFLYMIDLDGSFRPNQSVTPTISTLVASDNHEHLKFLDPAKCSDNADGCYSYCQNTCFRSMHYYVQGVDQANYKLKVCSRTDHSRCTLFKGGRRETSGPHEFTAHLPSGGRYDAVFLDRTGREITPTSVTEVVELTFCPAGVFEVTLFETLS